MGALARRNRLVSAGPGLKRVHPLEVTLVFKNEFDRDYFMGQLSDGFGENECDLACEGDFDEATRFTVTPFGDAYDHQVKLRREHPEYYAADAPMPDPDEPEEP